jgi:hypothetical protein
MHAILAEDIGVGLMAGFLFLATAGATLFAVGALIAAAFGNGPLTAALCIPTVLFPAVAFAIIKTKFPHGGTSDPEAFWENTIEPTLIMGAVPTVICLLAGFILWKKKKKAANIEA